MCDHLDTTTLPLPTPGARPRFYQRRHSLPKGHNPVRAALAVDAQRKLILDLGVLVALADEGSEQRELIATTH